MALGSDVQAAEAQRSELILSSASLDDETRDTLAAQARMHDHVIELIREERGVLRAYYDPASGLIRRAVDPGLRLGTDTTSTAFSLLHLLAPRLSDLAYSRGRWCDFTTDELVQITSALSGQLVGVYLSNEKDADSGYDLPNQYNSAIHAASILRASTTLGFDLDEQGVEALARMVRCLTDILNETDGFIYSLGPDAIVDKKAGNAYLTWWTGRALAELRSSKYIDAPGYEPEEIEAHLEAISTWGGQTCAEQIAFHHAGLGYRFDPVDLLYSSLCAIRFGTADPTGGLPAYGIDIVLRGYVGADGSLVATNPVVADRRSYSLVIQAPEALGTVLLEDRSIVDNSLIAHLFETYEWIRARRGGARGWGSKCAPTSHYATSFFAVSCLNFCSGLAFLIEEFLSSAASEALGAVPVRASSLDGFEYPSDIRDRILTNVVKPVRDGRRELAATSVLLYGPPGTAKTTLAKKVAHDLDWPLVVIGSGHFLRAGIAQVEAEAERIFDFLEHLRDAVVLFDEIEEILPERIGSSEKLDRFLTTALLPRLHDLRDKRRVVVILATNRPRAIDLAARRRGRIDLKLEVNRPNQPTRRTIVDTLYEKWRAVSVTYDLTVESVFDALNEAQVDVHTEGFTFGDLEECFRRLISEYAYNSVPIDRAKVMATIEDIRRESLEDRAGDEDRRL